MKLLSFGRAKAAPSPATAPATASYTRRGIVLVDDTDLTRYQNNYELYDTGPISGAFTVDVLTAPVVTSAKFRPPIEKTKSIGHSDPVVMLDGSGGRFYDTPIFEEDNTRERTRKCSVNSVDILPIPHNAIRTGGPVKLFGTQYGGLVANWLLLGFIQGATQTLVEPFFAHYLHMHHVEWHAIATLLQRAWLFKIVAAFLTDACPIRCERRKPYIYLGWSLLGLCMLVLVCLPAVEPFLSANRDVVNRNGADQGKRYIPWLVIASFGHLLVTVACEGMVVELAQREGEFVRGRVQCTVVAIELIGQALGTMSVSLGFNSVSFGGHFAAALSLQAIFGLFGFFAIVGMILTWFVIVDEVNGAPAQPIASQLRRIGLIAQRRPIWNLMVFGFLCYGALACSIVEIHDVYTEWLDARPLAINLSIGASFLAAAIAAFLVARVWINTHWRSLMLGSMALWLVVAIPIDLITYLDVWRNFVFFSAKDVLLRAFDTAIRLVPLLIIVEVAEPGFEASTYALATTAFHLAGSFVPIVINTFVSLASVEKQDLLVDSAKERRHVAIEETVVTAARIALLLAAAPFVPRQKRHAKELNARGTNGGVLALIVHGAFVVVYFVVVVSSVLKLSASTACYVLAGGAGCD